MKKVNIAFSLVLTTLFSLLLLSSCDERQMTDKTPEFTVSRIGYGYDGCFFYVENGKVFAENILTGQTAEFYGEGISECFANGEWLYCVKDNSVTAVKIADKSEKTVFESEKEIFDIWADENSLFYRQENAIFLYRKGRQPQLLIENGELCDYIPRSLNYIEYSVRSKEWADHVRENDLLSSTDFDETAALSYGYYGEGLRREWYGLNIESGKTVLLENYPQNSFYIRENADEEAKKIDTAKKYSCDIPFEEITDKELAKVLHGLIMPLNRNDGFLGVYRNEKTDISSLSEEYIRACAASRLIYGGKGLKEIISGMPDFLGIGDGLTETAIIIPEELFEYCVNAVFGGKAEIRHGKTVTNTLRILEYSAENRCYYAFSEENTEGICEYTVLDGYENNGDVFVVYDKYVYYDSANRALYSSADKTDEIDGKIYNDLTKTVEEYGVRYKHVFALSENGTYYRVSSEPVK
ncbi:MAG: hypothetical protein IJK34_00940 [Clostridia bacterium]|nr:hypothetical protein [Clostridia bacterium]